MLTTQHQQYTRYFPLWERCRHVIAGTDVLRRVDYDSWRVGGTYIPRPEGMSEYEYKQYIRLSAFFNATGRTVDAMVGLSMAKPANIEYPNKDHLEDVTLTGMRLREFVQQVIHEEVEVTRLGVLVDHPTVDTSKMRRVDAERMNVRPFLKLYKAEDITYWNEAVVNGKKQLTKVVLREDIDVLEDEFNIIKQRQYRILDLEQGVYRVRIMHEVDDGHAVKSEHYPKMNGQPLTHIPFYMTSKPEVRKPILLDLVDTNLAHYRNSALYERALTYVTPVPVVTGIGSSPDMPSFKVGGTDAWLISSTEAKAYYLEFTGQGLKPLETAIKEKEFRMSVQGARMLADEKKASEAQSTVEIRTAGERSIIANLAEDVSDVITKALKLMAQWSGYDSTNVHYRLNVDYGLSRLDYHTIKELVASWQSGAITYQTLFDNLLRGDVISPDADYETYKEQLEDDSFNVSTLAYNQNQEQDPVDDTTR
jgi:hypothetical protein